MKNLFTGLVIAFGLLFCQLQANADLLKEVSLADVNHYYTTFKEVVDEVQSENTEEGN